MRYIGSKNLLLSDISNMITENTNKDVFIFCDIFSGTGTVARFFKDRYSIISNDALSFSHTLQHATIENNLNPTFKKLKAKGILDPLKFLNNTEPKIDRNTAFIYQNYSPDGKDGRMYFTPENALRIDFIRQTISKWSNDKLINKDEFYYLLALLIEAVPFVSNITGTYGAYLKHWDNRAHKKLTLEYINVTDNGLKNYSYNRDANELIREISGDVLYIDPPYNTRQYLPNYHVLETIARYDYPEIYGVTGMRPYKDEKSAYCSKMSVQDIFRDLVENAKFKYVVVSYSSQGIMTKEQIKKIMTDNGIESTYKFKSISYRKYKSKVVKDSDVQEYLFFIQKKI
jgi:adenine-specific DNA-methyltransferase